MNQKQKHSDKFEEPAIEIGDDAFHSLESLNRAAARLAFLSEAGHTLSASLDLKVTFQSLARLVIPRLADWCTITLVRAGGSIERLALAHKDPLKECTLQEHTTRCPPNPLADTGPPYAIRTGKHELVTDITEKKGAEFLNHYCDDPEFEKILLEVGLTSFMTIPMKLANGNVIGAIWVARNRPERAEQFSKDDLALALDLAAIAATAVKNAALYEQALTRTDRLEIERSFREEFIRKQVHDIKTPLSATALIIDLLARKAREDPRVDELADTARENINRTVKMVENFAHEIQAPPKKKAG